MRNFHEYTDFQLWPKKTIKFNAFAKLRVYLEFISKTIAQDYDQTKNTVTLVRNCCNNTKQTKNILIDCVIAYDNMIIPLQKLIGVYICSEH